MSATITKLLSIFDLYSKTLVSFVRRKSPSMSDSSICALHVDKFPVVSWIDLSTSVKKAQLSEPYLVLIELTSNGVWV